MIDKLKTSMNTLGPVSASLVSAFKNRGKSIITLNDVALQLHKNNHQAAKLLSQLVW
jgi:hypothetical protein